ncbi:MAG TPA: alpha-hydroxy acid oxidase [Streptosporangiaceae bacterium]|nr:alpha-hydroxy acid oxidase [Streptosporangiaceae bacterium]
MKPIELDATKRRLARCHDIGDLRRSARLLIPRPVFDYVDGGADDELSMAGNIGAFRRWRFLPHELVDVSEVDITTRVLDRTVAAPLALAPTGYTRMMHPAGEAAAARSAARHGLPYTLSTMATTSIEDLAAAGRAAGHDDLWFQLYVLKDSGLTRELVERAAACGYRTLVVAVDTTVPGNRTRDKHNGLTIPPELTVESIARIGTRPAYWMRMLRSPAITFANFSVNHPAMTIEETIRMFSPSITWEDIAELRERWPGKLIIKGTLGAADARRAVEAGADGVQLSNHGGRQLDRAVAPVDLVPEVREAVGPGPCVLVDSGIRHGADLAVAIALGADAGVIGRAYLYGLMAGGEPGVDRALELVMDQFTRTLQLLGVTSAAELRKHGGELLTRA